MWKCWYLLFLGFGHLGFKLGLNHTNIYWENWILSSVIYLRFNYRLSYIGMSSLLPFASWGYAGCSEWQLLEWSCFQAKMWWVNAFFKCKIVTAADGWTEQRQMHIYSLGWAEKVPSVSEWRPLFLLFCHGFTFRNFRPCLLSIIIIFWWFFAWYSCHSKVYSWTPQHLVR